MAPPEYFEVRDVKNAFMRGHVGAVDRALALEQWSELRREFERLGIVVNTLEPVPSCEDMVFTANPAFNGLSSSGEPICVLGRMTHGSRAREVPAHRDWFAANGYRIVELSAAVERFEGGGDALWHPRRSLIWAAAGQRTDRRAHAELTRIFEVSVTSLELADERFYHLDTCFSPLNESTALIYPAAFTSSDLRGIRSAFDVVIEVDEEDAVENFACNGAAFFGRLVVMQRGSRVVDELRHRGFKVIEVETGEFLKSGGSVFCMKAFLS